MSFLKRLFSSLTDSQPKRVTIFIVVGAAVSTASLLGTLLYSVELSGLVSGAWLAVLGAVIAVAIDWSIKEIDTLRALRHTFEEEDGEIRERPPNVAWALILSAVLIMIGLAMVAGSG
jgi:hypothetical protein